MGVCRTFVIYAGTDRSAVPGRCAIGPWSDSLLPFTPVRPSVENTSCSPKVVCRADDRPIGRIASVTVELKETQAADREESEHGRELARVKKALSD